MEVWWWLRGGLSPTPACVVRRSEDGEVDLRALGQAVRKPKACLGQAILMK